LWHDFECLESPLRFNDGPYPSLKSFSDLEDFMPFHKLVNCLEIHGYFLSLYFRISYCMFGILVLFDRSPNPRWFLRDFESSIPSCTFDSYLKGPGTLLICISKGKSRFLQKWLHSIQEWVFSCIRVLQLFFHVGCLQ